MREIRKWKNAQIAVSLAPPTAVDVVQVLANSGGVQGLLGSFPAQKKSGTQVRRSQRRPKPHHSVLFHYTFLLCPKAH